MAEYYRTERPLTNENINTITTELIAAYTTAVKKSRLPETQFRIALEEILLQFRDCYGTDAPCRIVFGKHFGKYSVELSAEGERREWLPCDEDIKLSYDILANLGVEPRYLYSHTGKGRNRLIWESVVKEKKRSMLMPILLAVALAVIAGLVVNALPTDLRQILSADLVTPVFSKLTSILSALATPLVFLAVVCGIVGIGDVKSFGKMGARVMRGMLLSYTVAALVLGIGGIVAYGIGAEEATANDSSAIGKVVQLVLDIVPNNMFSPFAQGNDLQVIVIAIFVGITMLILGTRVSKLNDVVKDASELINKMMLICCKLLPLVVFFGVVNLIISSNAKQFISIGKMTLVYLAMNVVFLLYMVLRTTIITKTSILKIFPKQVATLIINLTTSSQVAALPENMKCCKEKFGIDAKLVDFGLPLGIVIYMPSGSIFLGVMAWGLSIVCGVSVPLGAILRIMLIATVLAIAAPPIPGSALVVLPVLLASCGVPSEALPLAIIFGTVVGYLMPAFNGCNIQLELLATAVKLKKIDHGKLRAVYKEE